MNFIERIIRFNKDHRVLSHVFFWLVAFFISITASKYYDGAEFTISFALIGGSLFFAPHVIASYFLTYFIIPRFFYEKRYLETAVYFIIGSYLICAFARILIVDVAEPIAGEAPKSFETTREILTDLPKLLYVYFFRTFALAFVFMFIKLLMDQNKIQKQALSLQKEKAETELKFLKAQLNPHFLFNTLNNIYSLSLTHSSATSESIGRLSEILDHILFRCNNLFVPLSTEVNLLNNYIGLEKLRYDERLKVNFNTSVDHDIDIAPLILLSIVENAFKHGAGEEVGDPVIDIDLKVSDDVFCFNVKNSCSDNNAINGNEKIGLNNLKHQLNLIYPGKYNLDIRQSELFFEVMLTIDLKPEKAKRYENTMSVG
jgi:sensor histidine kinase YesM